MLGAGECRMFEMLKYNCSVILETGDSITQRYTRHQAAGGLQEGGDRHRQQVWHLVMALSMTRGTLLTGTVRAADIFWSMLDSELLLLLDNYLHKTVMLFRSSIPDIVQTTVDSYLTGLRGGVQRTPTSDRCTCPCHVLCSLDPAAHVADCRQLTATSVSARFTVWYTDPAAGKTKLSSRLR